MKGGISFQERNLSTVCPNLAVERFELWWESRKAIGLPTVNK
jgi:hypothetical protein